MFYSSRSKCHFVYTNIKLSHRLTSSKHFFKNLNSVTLDFNRLCLLQALITPYRPLRTFLFFFFKKKMMNKHLPEGRWLQPHVPCTQTYPRVSSVSMLERWHSDFVLMAAAHRRLQNTQSPLFSRLWPLTGRERDERRVESETDGEGEKWVPHFFIT